VEILKHRKEILKKVLNLKKISLNLDNLEHDLILYKRIKIRLDVLRKERKDLQEQIKTNKPVGPELDNLKTRIAEIKTDQESINNEIWALEDSSILDFIKLPNCGPLTVFEDEIVSTLTGEDNTDIRAPNHTKDAATPNLAKDGLTYKQLIERDKLLEYSNNSHSAVYLNSYLAQKELSICCSVQERLEQEGFDLFSNPDFVSSVGIEGVEGDSVDTDLFHLNPALNFEDKESLNGMFLVGGASKYAFVSYFARHIIQNTSSLPLNLFCIGRQYKPVPEVETDLLLTAQSTVINFISLNNSRLQMEQTLDNLIHLFTDILKEYATVRIVKKGVVDLDLSEECRYSFQLLLPVSHKYLEIGHISIENDFYSRRFMFKQKDADSYRNIFTLTGNVLSVTRILAVILENQQFTQIHKNL